MWSYNRIRDSSKIENKEINWKGPFSWPGFEKENNLNTIIDVAGVYILSFEYKDGFLLYAVGITNSTRKRILTHAREYRKGNYNILDSDCARNGEREEIWHGWKYAKTHKEEFLEKKDYILEATEKQLKSFRIFIAEIPELRKRERIEAALMQNIYVSKESWSELADRGMHLKGRYNVEIPIEIQNLCKQKLYGLPNNIEI